MSGIDIVSLYSGSEGNAFLLRSSAGSLLIDAGKSARRLTAALAECKVHPSTLDAILITHEHTDHISALRVFLKQNPLPVHLARGCLEKLRPLVPDERLLVPHPPLWEGRIARLSVRSFPTSHDSQSSVGYRIGIPTPEGELLLGYATDLGYVTPEVEQALTGCQAVILESNHDPQMLREGPYPPDLKRRIAGTRGHLSNPDSAALAARLHAQGAHAFLLAHLSRENNRPALALGEFLGAVGDAGVPVAVADPDRITSLPMEEIR